MSKFLPYVMKDFKILVENKNKNYKCQIIMPNFLKVY